MSRKQHEPTDKERGQCKMLAAMGVPHEDIAKVIGITSPTLRKHYRSELELGKIEANAKVAQSLFRQATDAEKPNTVAGIFWMKCQAGWRDHDALSKKEIKEAAAEQAMQGRFAAPQPPPKLRAIK